MYVCRCFPACMSVYLVSEEAKRLPETEVTDACVLLCWWWERNPSLVQDEAVSLLLSHLSSPIAFTVNKQKIQEKIGLWSEVYCVIHLNTVCLREQLGEERVNFTFQLVHHPGEAGQEPGGGSCCRGHGRCCLLACFPGLLSLLSHPFRTTLWARPLLSNC